MYFYGCSVLLSKQLTDNTVDKDKRLQTLTDEYDLVKQAFFTEPEDQSGWFYLMWLLSQTIIPTRPLSAVNYSGFNLNVHTPSYEPCGEHQMDACIAWPDKDCKQSSLKSVSCMESAPNELLLEPKRHIEPLSDWQMETLKAQIETCRELLDLEKDRFWLFVLQKFLFFIID